MKVAFPEYMAYMSGGNIGLVTAALVMIILSLKLRSKRRIIKVKIVV